MKTPLPPHLTFTMLKALEDMRRYNERQRREKSAAPIEEPGPDNEADLQHASPDRIEFPLPSTKH